MTLSTTAKEAMYSQETSEIALFLLTVTHPDLPEQVVGGGDAGTFRFVRDNVNHVSRTKTYYGLPFGLNLPTQSHEEQAKINLTLEGPNAILINTLRSLVGPPNVKIELVLLSDIDTVEEIWFDGQWKDIKWNSDSIVGEIRWADLQDLPWPSDIFDRIRFPGLY